MFPDGDRKAAREGHGRRDCPRSCGWLCAGRIRHHRGYSSLSSVMGRSVMRLPIALNTALAMAGGTATMTLTEALDPDRVGDGVLAGQEFDVQRGHVRVDRRQVVRHVGVDDAAVAVVQLGALQQRHPGAHTIAPIA